MLKRKRISFTDGVAFIGSTPSKRHTGVELGVPGTSRARELVGCRAEAELDKAILSVGDYLRNRSEASVV